ncbi:MAG: histidine phosphatase family protein [Proteobacteria bacterium]|nr:histidine phosphatase family protein [Pseudomonadota bacterium]
MTVLAIIRHGPTEANAAGKLMGRADEALSPAGRRIVAEYRLPAELATFAAVTSPLKRARETAALLSLTAEIEPAIIEMDWGTWQGSTCAELRQRLGHAFTEEETRGLDMTPPDGESPRQVQTRLLAWLATLACPTLAVTHKGVIRALYALATGWTMLEPEPIALDRHSAHIFEIDENGRPRVKHLNLPLR